MPSDALTVLQDLVTNGALFVLPPVSPVPSKADTGGTVLTGVYLVKVSYVDAQGETTPSSQGTVTTVADTSTITIPSPIASGSAVSWYAYVTQVGGSVFTRQQVAGSPTLLGADLTLTAPPTNTGAAPQTANTTGVFNGAALKLPSGTPRRGLFARVLYSAAQQASGSGVWKFSLDVCYDGVPTVWNADFVAPPITLTSSAQSGEIFIPFEVSPTSPSNGTQIRLTATLTGSPVTPTITYSGQIVTARP